MGNFRRNAPAPPELLEFARRLRKNSTDAEILLWRLLRGRQIAEVKFRRQYPIPPYVLDFYCHELHLAIELDGGQHLERQQHDLSREAFLKERGVRILRYWNNQLLQETEAVLEAIYREVMSLKADSISFQTLTPNPSPGGRGE
ncbi:MAG: endonuclease domain-containing protein [Magnetococcales bacterium]|nr:endonuclease domain-containing protein [Magnetococcales bacterium]